MIGLTNDEERYIHTNSRYYEIVFAKLRRRKNRASWNWAAFLSPTCWFFYRKLYTWGLAAIIINSAICFIGGIVTIILALLFRLFIGLCGNNFYMQHIESVMRGETRLREPAKSRYISIHGGTSPVLAILAFIVLTIAVCLIFYYFYF